MNVRDVAFKESCETIMSFVNEKKQANSATKVVELKEGVLMRGHVEIGKLKVFQFRACGNNSKTLQFELKAIKGNSNLYISTDFTKPNSNNYQWNSDSEGDDLIEIPSSDPCYLHDGGIYFVGVQGALDEKNYKSYNKDDICEFALLLKTFIARKRKVAAKLTVKQRLDEKIQDRREKKRFAQQKLMEALFKIKVIRRMSLNAPFLLKNKKSVTIISEENALNNFKNTGRRASVLSPAQRRPSIIKTINNNNSKQSNNKIDAEENREKNVKEEWKTVICSLSRLSFFCKIVSNNRLKLEKKNTEVDEVVFQVQDEIQTAINNTKGKTFIFDPYFNIKTPPVYFERKTDKSKFASTLIPSVDPKNIFITNQSNCSSALSNYLPSTDLKPKSSLSVTPRPRTSSNNKQFKGKIIGSSMTPSVINEYEDDDEDLDEKILINSRVGLKLLPRRPQTAPSNRKVFANDKRVILDNFTTGNTAVTYSSEKITSIQNTNTLFLNEKDWFTLDFSTRIKKMKYSLTEKQESFHSTKVLDLELTKNLFDKGCVKECNGFATFPLIDLNKVKHTGISIEIWVNFSRIKARSQSILDSPFIKLFLTEENKIICLYNYSNDNDSSINEKMTSSEPIHLSNMNSENEWIHICLTFGLNNSNSNSILYINGLRNDYKVKSLCFEKNLILFYGNINQTANYSNIKLKSIRVWSAVLKPSLILSLSKVCPSDIVENEFTSKAPLLFYFLCNKTLGNEIENQSLSLCATKESKVTLHGSAHFSLFFNADSKINYSNKCIQWINTAVENASESFNACKNNLENSLVVLAANSNNDEKNNKIREKIMTEMLLLDGQINVSMLRNETINVVEDIKSFEPNETKSNSQNKHQSLSIKDEEEKTSYITWLSTINRFDFYIPTMKQNAILKTLTSVYPLMSEAAVMELEKDPEMLAKSYKLYSEVGIALIHMLAKERVERERKAIKSQILICMNKTQELGDFLSLGTSSIKGEVIEVKENVKIKGKVKHSNYMHYKFFLNEMRKIKITLDSYEGDADLYISNGTDEKCTMETMIWGSNASGDDSIEILPSDEGFKLGWFYLGVFGGSKGTSIYSLLVTCEVV